jgi:hypothetical protein
MPRAKMQWIGSLIKRIYFQAVWERIIKNRNTEPRRSGIPDGGEELMQRAVRHIEWIEPPKNPVNKALAALTIAEVASPPMSATVEDVSAVGCTVPDMLAYLQKQTGLTRSIRARILNKSEQLAKCVVDHKHVMDSITAILKH